MDEDAPIPPPQTPLPDGEPSPEAAEAGPPGYLCPHCDRPVEIGPHFTDPFIHCPHCGSQFVLAKEDVTELDDETQQADERARDAELDGMRIRQLSNGRRAMIRLRTYLFIGCAVSAVGGINLVIKTVQRVRHEHVWDGRTLGFIAFAIVCFMLAAYFLNRTIEMTRELNRPLLDEPTTPPDFSNLSDGSQHARDLEDIR